MQYHHWSVDSDCRVTPFSQSSGTSAIVSGLYAQRKLCSDSMMFWRVVAFLSLILLLGGHVECSHSPSDGGANQPLASKANAKFGAPVTTATAHSQGERSVDQLAASVAENLNAGGNNDENSPSPSKSKTIPSGANEASGSGAEPSDESSRADAGTNDDGSVSSPAEKPNAETLTATANPYLSGDDEAQSAMPDGQQPQMVLLYEAGMAILNSSSEDVPGAGRARGYALLRRAAALGHQEARRLVAVAHLFGESGVDFDPVLARQLLEPLAESGDAFSQLYIGFMHSFGLAGFNASQARALVYYSFAAIGGNQHAQMALGYRHYSGVGVAQSCEAALDYYRRVAHFVVGSVAAMGSDSGVQVQSSPSSTKIRLSDEYENPSRPSSNQLDDDLLQYYQFLADKGDVQAQVGLGHLHYRGGRGVQQDHTRALNYFTQAANTGNANAMAYLGKMFLDGGKVVPRNTETAFRYFSMAAQKGNPLGQAGLGKMYLYGHGVPKDHELALRFLTMAANQGLVVGHLELGNMFYHGLGVGRNYKVAFRYYQQASSNGNLLALYYLATMHARGIGTPRSCHNAVQLFKVVCERSGWGSPLSDAYAAYKRGRVDEALVHYAFFAELGYEEAQSNAAFILDRAESSLFNRNASFAWALSYWARAASQGYVHARLKLGDYHYYGQGTPIDYGASAFHYRVAAESDHNAQAMFNLAYMHEHGYGLPKDIHLAKRYYDLAALTSVDAQVPVMLALFKLAVVYGVDYISHLRWDLLAQPVASLQQAFGPDWDLCLMGFLAGIMAALFYIRRLL